MAVKEPCDFGIYTVGTVDWRDESNLKKIIEPVAFQKRRAKDNESKGKKKFSSKVYKS